MRGIETVIVNPNVNCLEGKRCPRCGSFGPFELAVKMRVLMFDTGTDFPKDGSVDFDGDTQAKCDCCEYAGRFEQFSD
jgi:hypothetical protein